MDTVGIRQVMAPRKMLAIASLAIMTQQRQRMTEKLKINSLNQTILLERTMKLLYHYVII